LSTVGNLPFSTSRIPIIDEAGKGDNRPKAVITRPTLASLKPPDSGLWRFLQMNRELMPFTAKPGSSQHHKIKGDPKAALNMWQVRNYGLVLCKVSVNVLPSRKSTTVPESSSPVNLPSKIAAPTHSGAGPVQPPKRPFMALP